MYSRQSDRNIRVPHNYSGNIFRDSVPPQVPVEDHTRKRPREYEYIEAEEEKNDVLDEAPYEDNTDAHHEPHSSEECEKESKERDRKSPILSPFGELGTEELLLIALALIVFGSGKEPDLALILLALLFIN